MDSEFMHKLRSFFGLRQEPPRNDFRNPIWGSDDDDDGDELYTRDNMDIRAPLDFHRELSRHMQDMIKSFGGMFGDMKLFLHHDQFDAFTNTPDASIPERDTFDSNRIRDYYLKPGYHKPKRDEPKDADLDGKLSSHEISGLLKKKDEARDGVTTHFDGNLVQGPTFCQTVITTSVRRADGTVETKRIVKRGNEVIEETTSVTDADRSGPPVTGFSPVSPDTNGIFTDFSSLFRNFY